MNESLERILKKALALSDKDKATLKCQAAIT